MMLISDSFIENNNNARLHDKAATVDFIFIYYGISNLNIQMYQLEYVIFKLFNQLSFDKIMMLEFRYASLLFALIPCI